MRNRWFHKPLLHTSQGEEKKVTWLELFYDLIFVASIIQLGDWLSNDVSLEGFALFAWHFVPLWIAWTGFTFYANRFEVDDFLHRVLVFLKMFAVGAMAIASSDAMRGHPAKFALAYALAQAIVAAMYLRAWRQVPEARAYSRYWGFAFAAGAAFFAVSALVPHPYCYILWVAGLGAILFAPISRKSRALSEQFPVDMEHLSERYGLLVIIVLGESFVKVLSYLTSSEHGAELEYLVKGSLNLLITCCIWWIYFDDVAGSEVKRERGSWVVWLYSHIPLTIAVTAVGVAVKKAVTFDFDAVADEPYRWLLAGSVALAFLAVAITDSVTERRQAELSDRTRVNVRAFSAFLVLLLGQVGATMTAGAFLAIITGVCVAQVLFDMMMAPLEEARLRGEEAVPVADLARRQAAGELTARDTRTRLPGETIRKGAPAELRRDLYFFFLEGSWTRLVLSLVFLYLVTNVLFAGLYMIEPGSIGGTRPDSFADAFFFSVQTMSTIGYGAMTPASDFGDIVVTIEAAVGLLGVALATGLMFAKASRPRAGVLFSGPIVLTRRHGRPALVFRVANARGNEVVDASVSLTVLLDEITPEGHHMRRLHDLKLLRDRSPLFALSWTVIHEIDDDSPLKDVDWSEPDAHLNLLVATLMGHDGTYGQTTYARHYYRAEDIRVGHRFVDVISQMEDGRLMIDYSNFHDTIADRLVTGEAAPAAD
jgi:inward rectifier potassium channel